MVLPARQASGPKGLSLPELLLVVSIIGLGVAASIPIISETVRSARTRAVADEFAVALRAVRMIAVTTRADAALEIVGDNAYRYEDVYGRVRNYTLPEGVRIDSTTAPAIIFRPNGSVFNGAQQVVLHSAWGGDLRETWTFDINTIGVPRVTRATIAP